MTYSGTYTEKECTKCGNVKPLEFFCAARLGRLGRSAECNTAIGMVKENQETLLNMVKYLKESQ